MQTKNTSKATPQVRSRAASVVKLLEAFTLALKLLEEQLSLMYLKHSDETSFRLYSWKHPCPRFESFVKALKAALKLLAKLCSDSCRCHCFERETCNQIVQLCLIKIHDSDPSPNVESIESSKKHSLDNSFKNDSEGILTLVGRAQWNSNSSP